MATATRARKPKGLPATSKNRKKVAEAPVATNGEATNGKVGRKRGGDKFAADQPTLPTEDMKKTNEKIKPLEDACQKVLSTEAKINEMKTTLRETNEAIGSLLEEHDLKSYIINGEQFFKKPSGERVVHNKLKLNG